MEAVCITGIGIITAIGNNGPEVLNALREGKTGIGPITHLETIHKGLIPVGEVKLTNEGLRQLLHLDKENPIRFTRTSLLGLMAAREAIAHAGLTTLDERTGLISATSVGGMDQSEEFFNAYFKDHNNGRLRDVISHDCGDSTEKIARDLGVRGIIGTISTACSSSVNSMIYAARLIKTGQMDRMIAGGADALTRFTINGFNTLMILDKKPCRPFDDTRAGLNLGEGAAFLVLESEQSAKKRGARILCKLSGYANANDAFHQTASSPDGYGATQAMSKALKMSGLNPEDISYINVHGTGTQNNDLSEGTAMKNVFGENIPPFSSTKPFTGHTLGAAGAVEAVLSVFSLLHGLVYPNLNFDTPMNELGLMPNTTLKQDQDIRHVLSNSFGFGGNNSTAIFSRSDV